jgi:SAM-dependent methyltransferase
LSVAVTHAIRWERAGHADAIEWLADATAAPVAALCPNCNNAGEKQPVLRTGWPGKSGTVALLRCPACGCGFVHPVEPADYGAEPAGGAAALAFYLQQGAGLWGITANLAALGRPPGARLLEVGCGFGFGLDFARRALGWEVLGLDPSPFAAAGRHQFGLPIESRYLTPDDAALRGQFDMVMASEVIEHVASPPDFVRTLWAALREGGTLVLTTPDIDAARPDTPRGLLVPLLSVGYHLVLQSAASLAALLREAGFTTVVVRRSGGASLVAWGHRGAAGSAAAVTDGGQYRRYLRAAADAVQRDGDLWFGLAARSYREAVNSADPAAADAGWADFAAACHRRFGLDPDAVRAPDAAADTLEDLAEREPLCLGPMLLHRALHRMLLGTPRSAVEPLFAAAVAACVRLRAALQRIGTDDGDAEDVAWVAQAEGILCAAERGAEDVPERTITLGSAPGDAASIRDGHSQRADSFKRRAFVSLVNAGSLDAAGRLIEVVASVEGRLVPGGTALADDELDVLYCAAVRELQLTAGSAARGLGLLRRLGAACAAARSAGRMNGSAVTLAAPARDAEILALERLGRGDEAAALRAAP